ncbi:hypothetical protein [Costertonia aggregata]|uniref:STAS/SEC14 domain-containing protein n=1 Tax=Costertonia aggregata TaxID=343403 RepID=A0A7H9APF5_9FLAO|nr:hypothetical protein [Costertonia aggregata]QLG45338.1 hypothetical protein HYG79_08250 [Costertonia aggregata]
MKCVREISFFKNIREVREFEFGVFYYFNGLVIAEIKEGVVFSWKMADKALRAAYEIFGTKSPFVYISNRINNYYILPTDWIKLYTHRGNLKFYSVVGTTRGGYISLLIERLLFRKSIRKFSDLEDAVAWSLSKMQHKEVMA